MEINMIWFKKDEIIDIPDYLQCTRKEAAKIIGCSIRTIHNYVKQGKLKRYKNKITGKFVYHLMEVQKIQREHILT